MEEQLKELMGDAYKENMTTEEIQSFFKNQVLGGGDYVNKEKAEAEKKKLQDALDAKNLELQNKMTKKKKKAAADKALQEQLEQLQKQLLEGKVNNSQYKATSITAKARLNSGIADDDKEYGMNIAKDEINLIKVLRKHNDLYDKLIADPERVVKLIEQKIR